MRLAGTSPKTISPPKNSSKQEIWSSQFFRDLSQVVRLTPRETPVPLYTRTSQWPIVSWETETTKNSPKTPAIFNAKSPGKVNEKNHKTFLESGQVIMCNKVLCVFSSGRVRPRQGTEICNFGAPSPLDFLNFLPWIFPPCLQVFCVV